MAVSGCDSSGKVSCWHLSSEGEKGGAVKHPVHRDPQFSTKKDLILNANSDQVGKSCLILVILALRRLRQEDYGFKASLRCIRSCLKGQSK